MTLQPLPNALVHRVDGDAALGAGYMGPLEVGADGLFSWQGVAGINAYRLWIQPQQAPYGDWWWRADGVVTNTEALATRIPVDVSGAILSVNFTTPALNNYVPDVSPYRLRGSVMFDDGVPSDNGLSAARAELADALRSVVRVFAEPTGTFATPCARLHPAAPWLAPSVLAKGRRTQRWEVWAVLGRVDSKASYLEMEGMVSVITHVLDALPGWSDIVWERPAPTDMGGTLYLAVRGIIETRAEV